MPKETVYDVTRSFDVEVNWSRVGGHVQVATVVPPAETADGPESLAALMAGWTEETKATATGLYATLDRDGINRLIRVLRRARDQSFGRDE